MRNNQGHLFIIAGPSGVGKNTIIRIISKKYPDLFKQVPSFTTRPARDDDQIHSNRITIGDQEFDELIRKNLLADWAVIHGYRYGKKKSDIEARLNCGQNMILEIDVKGIEPYKKQFKNVHTFFIKYRSLDLLRNRLKSTHQNLSEQDINTRYVTAQEEMKYVDNFEYVVESDENDPSGHNTAQEIEKIIKNILET